jgi:hypothetical protein
MDKSCKTCSMLLIKRYAESRNAFSNRIYCSRKCGNLSKLGKSPSEETRKKLRAAKLGKPNNLEANAKISGENSYMWKGGKPKCIDCGESLAGFYAKRCFPCYTKQATGEKSAHWKGGITPKNAKIRNSKQMTEWRTSIFQRDEYCCQICKAKGVHLHAHHVVPFSVNGDLRFDIDNGQTLCKECHKMVHSGINGLKQPAIIKGSIT